MTILQQFQANPLPWIVVACIVGVGLTAAINRYGSAVHNAFLAAMLKAAGPDIRVLTANELQALADDAKDGALENYEQGLLKRLLVVATPFVPWWGRWLLTLLGDDRVQAKACAWLANETGDVIVKLQAWEAAQKAP